MQMSLKEKSDMPLVKYFDEGLTPDMKLKAKEDLGETDEVIAESLKEMKSLIKREPDFNPCMDDKFLLRFLRAKKFNVEKAFKKLINYYTFKAKYSGIASDFKPSDIAHVLDIREIAAMEYRNTNYVGVAYVNLGELDDVPADDLFAAMLVLSEVGLLPEATQLFGYSLIIDCCSLGFRSAKKLTSPTFIYRFILGMMEFIPARVKSIHIINAPFFINMMVTLIRPLLTEKIGKRMHQHGQNLKSLHKYISPEILPVELGGKQGNLKDIVDKYNEIVLSHEETIKKMNKYGFQGETLGQLCKDNPNAIIT